MTRFRNIDGLSLLIETCEEMRIMNWSDGSVTIIIKLEIGLPFEEIEVDSYTWDRFKKKYSHMIGE